MKNLFLIRNFIFLLPIVFASCTLQKDEIYIPDASVEISSSSKNQLSKTGLELDNFFYMSDSSGTVKYDDGKLMYQIIYTSPFLFDTEQYEDKIVISNQLYDDQITLSNFNIVNSREITFDISTSEGYTFNGAKYYHTTGEKLCYWCVLIPVVETILEGIIENMGTTYNDLCAAAIAACKNGAKSINLVQGNWHTSASCSVICN